MRNYTWLFLSLLLVATSCQSGYKVGRSVVSIEPTGETVSLTLAGFSLPTAGRFTLGWDELGTTGQLANFTALDGRFYAVDPQGKLFTFTKESVGEWKSVESSLSMKLLAGHAGQLYGITAQGDLYSAPPADTGLAWKKLSPVKGATAFTSSGEKLYVTTDNGLLLEGTVAQEGVSWNQVAEVGKIRSLASNGTRLYALGSDTVLYQCELRYPGESWVRMGYNNGESYLIDVSQIAFLDGKLYAFAQDNKLYTNRHNSEGNLSSRALSITKGGKTAVIVSVDACGFDYSFTQSVKDDIYRKTGIPHEAVLINTSHSHFTPVTQSWITWEKQNQHPDTLYLNLVREGIVRSVEEALASAAPGELFFGRDSTVIGRNRRLRGDEALYDNFVDVLRFVPKGEGGETVLFLTGCHPVRSHPEGGHYTMSANYPGQTREILENEPAVSHSMFLQGCAGDINPKSNSYRETGEQLAQDVTAVLGGTLSPVEGGIFCYLDTIHVAVTPWSQEELQAPLQKAEETPEDFLARRSGRWARLMLGYYEQQGTPPTDMPVYVQTLNIGDWKLIGLSREATTEFSIAIKNLWPDQKVSVAAYTNDVPSYLATDPHIKKKDYEGYESFFWYGQPNHFPLGTFDLVVSRIKENNR
ncbi:MAG TPA: hypothetical protein GXZ56_03240 [Bacteroidales bacterium]|jgi:hypothetical protein|nr:hypothetical protein [Bacteroidales bacterium]